MSDKLQAPVDPKTAFVLAGQRASLLRMVSELDRVIEDSAAWRALSIFESVAIAAGGVETAAWKERHQELQTALAENTAFKLRLRLVAAIDALPSDDLEMPDLGVSRSAWVQPAGPDRRESIALRIATLQPTLENAAERAPVVGSLPNVVRDAAPLPPAAVLPAPDPLPAPLAPRAVEPVYDPVAAAARSILDALRLSVVLETQARVAPPVPIKATPVVAASAPEFPTVVSATGQISAEPAWQSAALETCDADLELDSDEAEVVVVQKVPLSTVTLEERLARMDKEAAGLVRTSNGSLAGALASRTANRIVSPDQRPEPVAPSLEALDEAAYGLEAKVEIVRRAAPAAPPNAPGAGQRSAPTTSNNNHAYDRHMRPTRDQYPAEPAAAFISATEEASVEIVRPSSLNAWRSAVDHDLQPVPVARVLKVLNGT